MSASIRRTFFPAWDKEMARFTAVVDLPSPREAEVIMIIRISLPTEENSILVRSVRYASAMEESGFTSMMTG
ncbi:hypothetical protein D3C78_1842440 [compost metagenome]